MFDDDSIQTLTNLGLTIYEAKVFLSLVKTGRAPAATVAKTSKLARPDVYRTLNKLQQKGFVEKIIDTPTFFKALPPKEVLAILIENYKHDFDEVQDKASALIWNLVNDGQPNYFPEDEPKFCMFSQSITFHRNQLALRALQKTFDAIVTMRGLQSILFTSVEAIAGALKRGVKIRVLVEKLEGEKSAPSTIKRLEKTHGFKIRYLLNTSNPLMSIYDNKEAFVCTCRNPALKDRTTLWTNNPCFLSIFREYFKVKWKGALESKLVY